jgi:hypothetical protein
MRTDHGGGEIHQCPDLAVHKIDLVHQLVFLADFLASLAAARS